VSCDARGGAVFIAPAIFDLKLLGRGFGDSGAKAGAAAAPDVETAPANRSEALFDGAVKVSSATTGLLMTKAGVAFGCEAFSDSAGEEVACCASNKDDGTVTAVAAAADSELAALAATLLAAFGGDAAIELGVGDVAVLVMLTGSDAARGFASPFRNRPLATRSVPLDCSMFIGLVSTRFAPMRNALATPI
jgi:acylphosphatase